MIDALLPRPRTCCSDLDLDRLIAGELADEPAARLRAHLASSPTCAARLALFEADARSPAPRALPAAAKPPRAWGAWLAGGSSLALAATVMLVVARAPVDDTSGADAGDTTTKGLDAVALEVHRRTSSGAEVVAADALVGAGDELRFVVVGAAGRTATVIDVDGAGRVSTLAGPVAITAARAELPGAVQLDATPGTERLTLFVCTDTPDLAMLHAHARTREAAPGCEAIARELRKR